MKVLIACEFSGVVREAFLRRGHDAYSCDLVPAQHLRDSQRRHITGDVRPLLKQRWDMVIAHPPCTYLCKSGICWLYARPGRWEKLRSACKFFVQCLNANAPRVCVENPRPHRHAQELIGRKWSTVIHPWQFGHWESKATCLWLRGLPNLLPTKIVEPVAQTGYRLSPSPDRGRLRSITFSGIAEAMAEQWGDS